MTTNNPPIQLNEAFPDWATDGGIFGAIRHEYDEDLPWIINWRDLDLDYFGNHSGQKKCSPLVYSLLEDGVLTDTSRYLLAHLLITKYDDSWKRLWEDFALDAEFDPFSDYYINENGTHSKTVDSTFTADDDTTDSSSLTYGKQDQRTISRNDVELNSRYGYNTVSENGEPVDRKTNTDSDTDTNVASGTDTNNRTSTYTATDTKNDDESGDYSRTITGLRGNTSKQSIIRQDRELWQVSFYDTMFKQVDEVLASLIYNRQHRYNPYSVFPFGYNNI